MAFPFVTETGFEAGTRGHFDSETDTPGRMDYPHYSAMAATPGLPAPWRGAYCARIDLSVSNGSVYVSEDTEWDTAVGGTFRARFMLWIGGPNFSMTDADEFAVFQCMAATNTTVQCGVYLNYTTANGYRLGIGSTSASDFKAFSLNRWHAVEVLQTAVTNASTWDAWLDNAAFVQVAISNAGAMTDGRVGVVGQDRTYAGWVLYDDVIADDARIFAPERRFPHTLLLTTSGHVFVGQGEIVNLSLLSGAATDNVLTVYDTDEAYTSDAGNIVDELKNTTNSAVVDSARAPFCVHRGCYVGMTGTNPRALVQIGCAAGYWSDAAVRNVGLHRRARTPLAGV